jgi:hypothetical protein
MSSGCFFTSSVAQAQAPTTPYARMAPLAQYLMSDHAEFTLARSAAPASISGDATVLVLKQHGYETAVKGTNNRSTQRGGQQKEVPALEAGAMCYMMSRNANLGDTGGHSHPHLMIYGPRSDAADWGSDLLGSPVQLNPQFQNSPEPLGTFMVVVDRWSDGTSAPIHGQ